MVAELIKRIPPIPPVPLDKPSKFDNLADRIARHNPKIYDRKLDPLELEDWIRGMEKVFTIVEVTTEKKVNIGTFYLAGEEDI